jgi:predicted transposase/invertase (TIGR01784 family)
MYISLLTKDEAAQIKQSGIEEGKLEIARNLLANGVSSDVIAKSSGLPLDKIQALAN